MCFCACTCVPDDRLSVKPLVANVLFNQGLLSQLLYLYVFVCGENRARKRVRERECERESLLMYM